MREESLNFFSTIDGVVTYMLVTPESLVGKYRAGMNSVLMRIDRPGSYIMTCAALDSQLRGVRPGSKATVTFGPTAEQVEGRVLGVVPSKLMIERQVPIYNVTIGFETDGPLIGRDLLATAKIDPDDTAEGLFVPWNALKRNDKGPFVVVSDPSGGWQSRQVKLGVRTRDRVEIRSGLTQGEIIKAWVW